MFKGDDLHSFCLYKDCKISFYFSGSFSVRSFEFCVIITSVELNMFIPFFMTLTLEIRKVKLHFVFSCSDLIQSSFHCV